ncbi:hypothetical protein [Pseudomonas aeruginosa]|uniref:hypothetical protein n=1 Tax=Pseudomonas aeruginosa TaxID=287 RepID=UPI0023B32282|nr:hypothetical protein [Pseudomonas aeruginosa]MDE9749662.1 hypothetical protein [Pseudomonas aeruginosa]
MDANDLAGFAWIFGTFPGVVEQLVVSTSPLMVALSNATGNYLQSGVVILLAISLFRVLGGSATRQSAIAALMVALVIIWGLQPHKLTLPSGTTVDSVNLTAHSATVALSIQQILAGALQSSLSERFNKAGEFLPAQSVTSAAVERAASQFGNTDLARLIRDYNAQCNPDAGVFKETQNSPPIEAYHAIGLMGGGGLGIPEAEVSRMAQLSKAWDIFSTPAKWMEGPGAVLDLQAVRSRRSAGIEALKEKKQPFVSASPYKLPTKGYWLGVYRGEEGSTPEYLKVGDAPNGLAATLEKNVQAWKEGEDKSATQGYSPSSCLEAYQTAQFAAEQAYGALIETGKKATGGQRADTDSGAIGAALAWQRTVNRALNDGESATSPGTTLASGSVATLQLLKSLGEQIDLYTLVPMYVAGCAALLWLVLTCMPLFLIMALIRGPVSLTNWLSLVMLPVLLVVVAQLVVVAASIVIGSVAISQAAAAAGWQGNTADLDITRGGLLGVFGLLLTVSGFIVMKLTGVGLGAIGSAAQNSTATLSEVAGTIGRQVMGMVSEARADAKADDRVQRRSGQRNGGGGGNGGGGPLGDYTALNKVRSSQEVSHSFASPGSHSRSSLPALVPRTAANNDRFAQGRTPRSHKPKRSPKEDT